jgi:hypothetical protein
VHSLNGEYTSVLNGTGGIVLFHDTKKQTAAMLSAFLRFLKKGGYRVVPCRFRISLMACVICTRGSSPGTVSPQPQPGFIAPNRGH